MTGRADPGGNTGPAVPSLLAERAAVFDEMGDLKRIRVAHADGSVAERAFARAWQRLVSGGSPARIAVTECAAAAAATRLSGVDADVLLDAGCADADVVSTLETAVRDVVGQASPGTTRALSAAVPDLLARGRYTTTEVDGRDTSAPPETPGFVAALARQPRAGATAPGRRRRMVEPPENHAEHCWAVAVYGALLALDDGLAADDVGRTFLLGLAHHLHNADLPDSGFVGELALGLQLDPIVHRLTERRIATLPSLLGTQVRQALGQAARADSAVGRAFHAADVLDRVLQVHHHARAATFTSDTAIDELDIVHDGPVAAYHDAVLVAAGLGPARDRSPQPAGTGVPA